MGRSSKIAVSLPKGLLDALEVICKETGESRSAFFQRAIRELLDRQERNERISKYVEGYKKHPETKSEIKASEAAASRLLAGEPWE